MPMPKTPQEIQVFNGMAQFYRCFIKNFASTLALITKLLKKVEMFEWTIEYMSNCLGGYQELVHSSSYTY